MVPSNHAFTLFFFYKYLLIQDCYLSEVIFYYSPPTECFIHIDSLLFLKYHKHALVLESLIYYSSA